MIELIKKEIINNGDRCRVVSIERLKDLKKDIDNFIENEDLNNFQKHIVNDMYKFNIPDVGFVPMSIIIIAVPRPAYANIEFILQGKKYMFKSLVISNMDAEDASTSTIKYLKKLLEPKKHHIKYASDLPLKRLAVRSGLAVYGRNNICYVNGMGSLLEFAAFFTDVPCFNDEWNEIKHTDICSICKLCIDNCPTDAIKDNKFLIDNERCLSYFNEGPGEFPEWLPLTAHHCLYDCLKCQIICPLNKDYVNNIIGPIKFNEQETDALLTGKQFQEFSPELHKKIKILGIDKCLKAIPRNLKVLFELNKQ